MKKIFLLIFIAIIFVSCDKETKTTLGNTIKKFKYDRIYGEEETDFLEKARYKNNTIDTNTPKHDEFEKVDAIADIKILDSATTGIFNSAGVFASQDYIAILDCNESNIKILDWNGHILKTVGKLGSDKLEFKKPSAISYNEYLKKFYIYDSGNRRVVVLDDEFNFIENIKIEFPVESETKELGTETEITSIAVDDEENIYIVPYVVYSERTAYLYKFKNDGNAEKLYDFICGFLKAIDGKIYYVQNMEFYQFDNEFTANMGEEILYELKDDKLIELAKLPYKYYTDDIEISDGKYYLFSSSWVCLQKFKNENGKLKYIETLTPQIIPPDYDRSKGYGRYMTTSRYKNKIVMADRFTGNIYIVDISDNKNK